MYGGVALVEFQVEQSKYKYNNAVQETLVSLFLW